MEAKRARDTAVIMAQPMMPQDANAAGNVHGGVIMKFIDSAAAAVAKRHARCNVVTASIDRIDFHRPGFIGELITFKASMNYVGRTSMDIGVRVEAENLMTGEVRHTNSAYLTFVALDEDGRPKEVPPLILETEDDIRRSEKAKARREATQLRRKKAQEQKERKS